LTSVSPANETHHAEHSITSIFSNYLIINSVITCLAGC